MRRVKIVPGEIRTHLAGFADPRLATRPPEHGAKGHFRGADLSVFSGTLYQLSYFGIRRHVLSSDLVHGARFERARLLKIAFTVRRFQPLTHPCTITHVLQISWRNPLDSNQ